MKHDIIADALNSLVNAEKTGKSECVVKPVSNLLKDIFKIMKDTGYIGEFEYVENKRGGIVKIEMKKKLNNARAIKPRFPCKNDDIERFEKRFLPAKGFGMVLISTPKGLMTNVEAKKKGLGGTLIAYVY